MHQKIELLAFAAHPDDVEISISGTMIKHKKAGLRTGIIDLTGGELGTRGNIHIRAIESENASKIMQLDVRENLGLSDGFFEINRESLHKVIIVLRKYRPDTILINAPIDRHPDHGLAHELLKKAVFLSGLPKVETEFEGIAQEAWRPKSMYAYIQDKHINPDVLIDVSEFWQIRMEALKAYSSQFHNPESDEPITPISTPEFLDYIEGRAIQFGRLIGCRHAEGLLVIRPAGVNLLTDLF